MKVLGIKSKYNAWIHAYFIQHANKNNFFIRFSLRIVNDKYLTSRSRGSSWVVGSTISVHVIGEGRLIWCCQLVVSDSISSIHAIVYYSWLTCSDGSCCSRVLVSLDHKVNSSLEWGAESHSSEGIPVAFDVDGVNAWIVTIDGESCESIIISPDIDLGEGVSFAIDGQSGEGIGGTMDVHMDDGIVLACEHGGADDVVDTCYIKDHSAVVGFSEDARVEGSWGIGKQD